MDMRHPLDGISAKIRRAKEQLSDLDQDIDRRRQAHEYGIRVHVDPTSGEQFVYAYVPYELRIEWGLKIGDIVHNLRSDLDHLVVQLVIANGKTPGTYNEFPIYSSLKKYREDNGLRKLKGISNGAVTIIEGLQPKSTNDPLWVLSRLDNDDKHNLVHIATFVADLGAVGIGGTGFIRHIHITTTRAKIDGIEDGADLYSRLADPGVHVQTRPEIKVTFAESGPGDGKEVVPLLTGLVDYIENSIIPLFGLAKTKPREPTWMPPNPGHLAHHPKSRLPYRDQGGIMPVEDKTYRNAVVRLTELVDVDGLLDGFVFEGCQINGPAIMVPTQGTTITHNKMGADSSALLWEIPPSRPVVVGCIEAKGCTFDGCTFANVGIAGPPDLIKAMREGAT